MMILIITIKLLKEHSINKIDDEARLNARRTSRNYMNLQLKLLVQHSENDTFITRYWLAIILQNI